MAFMIITGCSQGDIIKSNYTIKSGSSFGMCVGPCFQEVSVNESQAVLRIRENKGEGGLSELKVENKRAVSPQEWGEIQSLVNQEAITALPKVIGCPDCADGGAEWIEIQSPGLVKKVTFEYGQPPAQIKELVDRLRETRESLSPQE
ncbi:hypothetical protein [Gracilimonas sediminicola]|uniref:Uncharacterized protein n=1 Tax=Gracilimonas sediminicola TaxID=2952158 RepID=A0A9X2RHH1_9BACT|nr:hypothetical protein [Gracilimonas sediminicola]MCP9292318.1 hypothetical protein [Gracilimonas sediminicola]